MQIDKKATTVGFEETTKPVIQCCTEEYGASTLWNTGMRIQRM